MMVYRVVTESSCHEIRMELAYKHLFLRQKVERAHLPLGRIAPTLVNLNVC
jgi:hypothetical protein